VGARAVSHLADRAADRRAALGILDLDTQVRRDQPGVALQHRRAQRQVRARDRQERPLELRPAGDRHLVDPHGQARQEDELAGGQPRTGRRLQLGELLACRGELLGRPVVGPPTAVELGQRSAGDPQAVAGLRNVVVLLLGAAIDLEPRIVQGGLRVAGLATQLAQLGGGRGFPRVGMPSALGALQPGSGFVTFGSRRGDVALGRTLSGVPGARQSDDARRRHQTGDGCDGGQPPRGAVLPGGHPLRRPCRNAHLCTSPFRTHTLAWGTLNHLLSCTEV
jgi:hypothetical protein